MVTRTRCLLVQAVVTTLALAVGRWAAGAVGAVTRVDEAVAALAGLALAGCAAWAWVVCTVVVAQALRSPGRPQRPTSGVPAWAARAVLAACGVAALASAPAQAASYDGPPEVQPAVTLDGLPFPDRAVGPAQAARAPGAVPGRVSEVAGSVVVRPGDSLWAIAEARLAPGATDAEVAAATTAWFEHNRDVVGTDPDLIQPALRLRSPGS